MAEQEKDFETIPSEDYLLQRIAVLTERVEYLERGFRTQDDQINRLIQKMYEVIGRMNQILEPSRRIKRSGIF